MKYSKSIFFLFLLLIGISLFLLFNSQSSKNISFGKNGFKTYFHRNITNIPTPTLQQKLIPVRYNTIGFWEDIPLEKNLYTAFQNKGNYCRNNPDENGIPLLCAGTGYKSFYHIPERNISIQDRDKTPSGIADFSVIFPQRESIFFLSGNSLYLNEFPQYIQSGGSLFITEENKKDGTLWLQYFPMTKSLNETLNLREVALTQELRDFLDDFDGSESASISLQKIERNDAFLQKVILIDQEEKLGSKIICYADRVWMFCFHPEFDFYYKIKIPADGIEYPISSIKLFEK